VQAADIRPPRRLIRGERCQIFFVFREGFVPFALREFRVAEHHLHLLPILAVRLLLDHDAKEGLRARRILRSNATAPAM
jgi:hypothetical protein